MMAQAKHDKQVKNSPEPTTTKPQVVTGNDKQRQVTTQPKQPQTTASSNHALE